MSDRYLCNVLEDMRMILKELNATNHEAGRSVLVMLVEEAQLYGNRMEDGLNDHSTGWTLDTVMRLKKTKSKLRKEVAELQAKKYEELEGYLNSDD